MEVVTEVVVGAVLRDDGERDVDGSALHALRARTANASSDNDLRGKSASVM
ncbi:hypothetical protein FHS29_003287 [Saccharothrix tamanrassetensis]|uniref:Uncharacterized protein n=1 Tax=Saccharothrix tamanrassetensis TaxID=1051531 RepID=A0A841CH48_9PSEU|nr:hypothetical protein [Saccharothrix tamanrassetensis]MBB5956701.1 hypothetical protein [Saccharothrix tamanrassetensis]